MFTLTEIVAATGGRIIGNATGEVTGVSTDSRSIAPGELFVPLRGEKFDGHDFIPEVAGKGITALLANESWLKEHSAPATATCIAVKNTLRALGELAASWRQRFEILTIGVTGSNGKTTVKEMLATILGQNRYGLKTAGNLNNLIGLPQMLLQLRPEHSWAVFEMGMSEPGEIDRLAEIAQPHVGIVLNALPAHLRSMGTIEAVAAAKGELLHRISDGGLAVVNADDPRVASLSQNASARRISFGIDRGEVRAKEIEGLGVEGQRFLIVTPKGEISVHLRAFGRHNVYNALAVTAALLEKVELSGIAAGLESFRPYRGRFKLEHLSGVTIIDDSYNANPASTKAALETLSQIAAEGHRIAVLGDMLELGEHEAEAHLGVGAVAGRNSDRIYLLGKLMNDFTAEGAILSDMPAESIFRCTSHAEIAKLLHRSLRQEDMLLIKGSRGMAMENVIVELKKLMQKNSIWNNRGE
ncbi:MAG: UDP-N-acetylmuramoyl-tripeptide--D-alanyl-D-alanine ligase [Desulfuromonadaceae bacterium]|nr:UDP-N-acetylmuramoyl-tripeptide--D-alanyl-D-alanine ligase [Desulfuromonadaceae bacterium]